MDLKPYQQLGRDFLAARKTAALYDDMRLGKTRQFLMAAKQVEAETIAVVAKATGVYEWEMQSREAGFNPVILKSKDTPLEGRFNIMSYNALCSDLHPRLLKMRFDLVGGDETDQVKNHKAKRTKAFYGPNMDRRGGLTGVANRIWVMTGTPMLNNPSELWPTIHALWPDAIVTPANRPMSYWQFVGKYCVTRENDFGTQIIGGKNLYDLRDKLRGRILRRTKADVWKEWKKPVIDMLPVEGSVPNLPTAEMDAVRAALSNDDVVSALAAVAEQAASLRRLTGLAKVGGVVNWIDDNMDEMGKVIVFAHHREVLDLLKSKVKHKYVEIIGGMTSEQKREAYMAFQNDDSIKVFFGQNQAARDSIPLWKASTAISVEPDWVPGNNDQMMDRMSFIEKHEPCTGYYATLRGSIDEDIQRALLRKKNIINQLGL
jgi:SNF2 family DNA or RNA helicase